MGKLIAEDAHMEDGKKKRTTNGNHRKMIMYSLNIKTGKYIKLPIWLPSELYMIFNRGPGS